MDAAEQIHATEASRVTGKGLTKLDREERINFAAQCLTTFAYKHERLTAIKTRYSIQARQAEEYLRHARNRILEATKMPLEEWRAEQVNFYYELSRNPLFRAADRINASKRIDKLVGTEQAVKVEVRGSVPVAAQELVKNATTDELLDLRRRLGVLAERTKTIQLPQEPSAN